MSRRVHGEQDWSVIDPMSEKVYDGIFNVLDSALDNRSLTPPLLALFGKEYMQLFGKKVLIESAYRQQIIDVIKAANITVNTPHQKAIGALNAQQGNIQAKSSLKKFEKNNYMKAIVYAKKFFVPDQKSLTAQN